MLDNILKDVEDNDIIKAFLGNFVKDENQLSEE